MSKQIKGVKINRRRSYGLTKEKAQRLSSNTRNSYLDQYCDYKEKELNDD